MIKTKKLIIVGDSAFAQIAKEYFESDSEYSVVAFSVERDFLVNSEVAGLPVVPLEEIDQMFNPSTHEVYVAIVYTQLNRLRARLAKSAKSKGYRLASYVSKYAFVWPNAVLGEHHFIFENNTIQPFVHIGENVVLWSGNHIGHHSTIGDNCFISSHVVISGFCNVGQYSFIGVNATLANNVTLGCDNWIGPNVSIMKNTEVGTIYRAEQPEPAKISALRFFKVRG